MLKSECVGSKSFCRVGGFQFNAFNQMEGASNQAVNRQIIKNKFHDRLLKWLLNDRP